MTFSPENYHIDKIVKLKAFMIVKGMPSRSILNKNCSAEFSRHVETSEFLIPRNLFCVRERALS